MSRHPHGVHPEVPGPGQESVWDYPRPPRVEPNTHHLVVVMGGEVIAETRRGFRVVETAHPPTYYFPPEDVRAGALVAVDHTTVCEFKGTAIYYDVHGGGAAASRSAWSYPTPEAPFAAIAKHVAFFAAPMDRCMVDGEVAEPQPGGFYGGWVTSQVVGPFKGQQGSRHW